MKIAVDLDGVGSCFNKARYKSVIVKTESGTDNKILIEGECFECDP